MIRPKRACPWRSQSHHRKTAQNGHAIFVAPSRAISKCKRKWENKTVVMGLVERGAWGSRRWQEGRIQRSDRGSSEATLLALADKLKQHLRPGRQPRGIR